MNSSHIPALPWHPTVVRFGPEILADLPAVFRGTRRLLVVATDGTRQRMATVLDALRQKVDLVFAEPVPAETTLSAIAALVQAQRSCDCDLILAIGGGATMDAAKALAIGIPAPEGFEAILEQPDRFAAAALPLICIPTTSGSGSDITPYATIWDTAAGRKRSLAHPRLLPRATWIDPTLTVSLPAAVTASSGLDALSHAFEAIWSRNHAPRCDRLAALAIRLIVEYLPIACAEPQRLDARTAMSKAALAAGLAISVTRTAAAHAGSYPLTLHHGIAHGHACALSLPWLLRWNATHSPGRVAIITEAMGESGPDSAACAISALIERTGLPARLRDLGVPQSGLPALAAATLASDRIGNSLRNLTTGEVDELFVTIW